MAQLTFVWKIIIVRQCWSIRQITIAHSLREFMQLCDDIIKLNFNESINTLVEIALD